MENDVDVWNDLKERFSQGDHIRISEIQQEIYDLRQGSFSVIEFYSKLKILWEELETYMPIPCCSCPVKCTCAAMRNARHFHSLNYAIRFLIDLNENFSVVKSQILLMDPLPSLNKKISMVILHEKQGNFAVGDDSKSLINVVDYKRPQGRGRGLIQNSGSRRICTYCGRNGHTMETCYRKHGLPFHLQKGNASMANKACNDVAYSNGDFSTNGEIHTAPPSFTHEQYEKLLNLIQGSGINQHSTTIANEASTVTQVGHSPAENHKSGKIYISSSFNSFSLGSWIIDLGASDHIYALLKSF